SYPIPLVDSLHAILTGVIRPFHSFHSQLIFSSHMNRGSVSQTRLFVGNIPKDMSPVAVKEQLEKKITENVKISVYPMGDASNKNRGFAFVDFEDFKSAKAAMPIVNSIKIGGRSLSSDWAEKESEVDESIMKMVKKLYARNLPPGISSSQLIDWLESDKITHCKIMGSYAFVHFGTRDSAEIVLNSKNGRIMGGNEIELTWAKPAGQKRSATSPIFCNGPPLIPLPRHSTTASPLVHITSPFNSFAPLNIKYNLRRIPFDNSIDIFSPFMSGIPRPSLLAPNQIDLVGDSVILDRIASSLNAFTYFYFIPQSPVIILAQILTAKNVHNVKYETNISNYQNTRHYSTQGCLPTGKVVVSLPCLSPHHSITMAAQQSIISLIEDGIILSSETFAIPTLPIHSTF
ncbi:hypothetical protein PFISCL1PPCAC_15484, partial [Pristionchus fissidentatus]